MSGGTLHSSSHAAVLFVIGSLDVGGAERHLLQIVPELQRRGRPVLVPNSRPRSPIRRPMSLSCSVGNGPWPTRVV